MCAHVVSPKINNQFPNSEQGKYDSTDSSDSGVGADSTAWSPCSSVTYSPPPTLTDEESPVPSPPSSDTNVGLNTAVSCMAPNDASRALKSNPVDPSCLMGRCILGGAEAPSHGGPILHSPSLLKGKPPDDRLRSPRLVKANDVPKVTTRHKSPRREIRKSPSCVSRCDSQTDSMLYSRISAADEGTKRRCGVSPRIVHPKDTSNRANGLLRRKLIDGKTDARNNNLSSRYNNNNIKGADTFSKVEPHTITRLPSVSSCSGESTSSGVGSCSSSDSLTCKTTGHKVRFPVPQKKDSVGDICRWRACGMVLDQSVSLLEHIQAVHVEGQLEAESFRCLWVGCKVFERASCSVSWLERHVLTHGGHKPFKCIVEGCGQRFGSERTLGRHVNQHFSSPPHAQPTRPHTQPSPNKLIRKNGRKLRYRKKPFSETQGKTIAPRSFDFFDVSCMEQVRWSLIQISQFQRQNISTAAITFTPEVIGKRKTLDGTPEAFVSWTPKDMLPDEWVCVEDVKPRSVSLNSLSSSMKATAFQTCFPTLRPTAHNKRKRDPLPRSQSII